MFIRGSRAVLLATVAALIALAALASLAGARRTHTYQVVISLSVDRSGGLIEGEISSEPQAPSFFCELGTIRIMEEAPGTDRLVARVRINEERFGKWSFNPPPALHGAHVYAETSRYHLPQRPIECLAAHSNTVTAP